MKIDFNYIDMLAEDDQAFKLDYVNTFEKTAHEVLPSLSAATDEGKWDQVGKLAHQLKPSAKMIKLSCAGQLEQIQHNPELCTPEQVTDFKHEFEEAIRLLKEWAS